MEKFPTNTQISLPNLATYQCVVCQTTYISLTELHRHQSYRHTPEELSLSTIGLHFSSIKMFESSDGIVYDNSWLHDPSRHAEFYAYSSNMLCDNNNNGCIVDCTKKNQVMEESYIVADKAHNDRKINEETFINENFVTMSHTINEPLLSIENFTEQEICMLESTILDLSIKVSSDLTKDETEMQVDTITQDPIKRLCDDLENMNRTPAKRGSSSRKCPTPRKVRRVVSKKKLCTAKSEANTQVIDDTTRQTVELEKQNNSKVDSIEQELIFGSQDSLSHFNEKNRLPVVQNIKFGISQKKPLNLTKVVKKMSKQRSIIYSEKSENKNCRKPVAGPRVSNFSLEHFLTYLKDQKKQINDKPADNLIKQDAPKKKENIEEIQALNLTKEKTTCDAVILSSQGYENGSSLKSRSIFDPETPASCLECKETKIEIQSGVNIGKLNDTEKKTKHRRIVADNVGNEKTPVEMQKCSNQGAENENSFEGCSISDPELSASSFQLQIKEAMIDTVEPPTEQPVKAEIATRKITKILNTVIDTENEEKAAFKTQYSSRCYKNREPKYRSMFDPDELISLTQFDTLPAINAPKLIASKKQTIIFNSAKFSSAFEEEEIKVGGLSTVKAKKRATPRKRAKNTKTVTNKLSHRETFREINDQVNQNYENNNFAKEKSIQVFDVYSYTDNDSEDEAITTLFEFRANRSASFEKKCSAKNVANINCSHDNSSFTPVAYTPIGCSSNEEQINAQPLEETKQRRFPRKKAVNLKIASSTTVVDEAGQVEHYVQDGTYENSVEQNSVAIPDANSHTDYADEEATMEIQQEDIVEKSNTFEIQTEDVETATDDPITRATQEIDALLDHVYANENFEGNNSNFEIEYYLIQNENEGPTIGIPCTQNLKIPNDGAIETVEAIDVTESQQCENSNFSQQDKYFTIDYCTKDSENQSSSRNSAVSFVAYPPGIDEYSALVFDPEIGHLVWRNIEMDDSEVYDLQLDEMPSSGENDNDNHPDSMNNEDISVTSNVDSEMSSTSWIPAEINILPSDGDSNSQNNNCTRRSTRRKKAINRYVP